MTRPPNIVLFTFDDAVAIWNYKAVFGAALHTPNFDRICAQSTAFHAAYCQAPICGPSRASFMSGKAPHVIGRTELGNKIFDTVDPRDLWPYLLKQNGYFTSSGGKITQGYVPLPPAIHEVLYCDAPKRFTKDNSVRADICRDFGGLYGGKGITYPDHDDWFYDHQSASSAIDFFHSYDRDAPFYREVGFFGPHNPWITPQRFKEMYDPRQFCQPDAWAQGFESSAYLPQDHPRQFPTQKQRYWRKTVRNYFSAISHADHNLGRMWDGLKSSPHADTTVVIIASDHGLHCGERGRHGKYTLYEQVANVPLVLHDPTLPAAQVVDDPVALIDIGPTVMDYAGLPALDNCPGRSLRDYAHGARDPDRAVPTVRGGNAGIRRGRYRFNRYEDGSTELYDLARDWWQTRNLGPDHPAFAEMQAAHLQTCRQYGFDPLAASAAA
ncbi:MAG: sulfatase-like hydrolase/transferase [Pseudomonadota bacterium]